MSKSKNGSQFTFGDADDIFKQIFGGSDSFAMNDTFGRNEFGLGDSDFDGFSYSAKPQKGKRVDLKLYLSLEELYNGCTKSMKVRRQRLNNDRRTTSEQANNRVCYL